MREIQCKRALTKSNSVNYYNGCSHNCLCCTARSRFAGQKEFSNIGVKTNILEVLENDLWQKRKKCVVSLGLSTDPYQPIEKEYQITRSCLELLLKRDFGVFLRTKSDLIYRDLDLLKKIGEATKATVEIPFFTVDDYKSKKLEPNVMAASKRFELIRDLKDLHIQVVAKISPVLPYINDDPDEYRELLKKLIQSKIDGLVIRSFGTRLARSSLEHFYSGLERVLPQIYEQYLEKFGQRFIFNSSYSDKLNEITLEELEDSSVNVTGPQLYNLIKKYHSVSGGTQISFFDNIDFIKN